MAEERLQKVMASAGIGSRRACEKMIQAGRVQIAGKTVTELGTKADPDLVSITVDGKPLQFQQRYVYVKLNKPTGVLSDIGGDTRGMKTVGDLAGLGNRRVFPVGRLDLNSEGLVLMTDDGDLAHRLTHPRFQHNKTYYVLIGEQPTAEALRLLRTGVEIETGKTAPADVQVVHELPDQLNLAQGPRKGVWLRIVLREGKKRQIRHMTASVGYPTLRLIRWAIGPLDLGKLAPGESAHLTHREVSRLRESAGVPNRKNDSKQRPKSTNRRNSSRKRQSRRR